MTTIKWFSIFSTVLFLMLPVGGVRAELGASEAKQVRTAVADKAMADFIIKHAKRIRVRGNKLQRLDLSKQGLTHLPEGLMSLTSLTYLNLSNNKLHEFPKQLLHLSDLESLSLIGNDIRTVPPGISRMRSLETLNLFGNELTSLPDTLCQLGLLKELKASDNKLTSLPECIGSMKRLRVISVYDNRLTALPAGIVNLDALYMLSLKGNQLKTLPNHMGRLTKMRHLNIEGNPWASLPASLARLDAIESIGVTFGDKAKKYERRRGETPKQFFERCYRFSWRDDSAAASAPVAAKAKPAAVKRSAPKPVVAPEIQRAPTSAQMSSRHIDIIGPLKPHTPIKIRYREMPGNQGDWVTLVRASESDNSYGDYFYPYGKNHGNHSFIGVPAGNYEVRVYYDWPAGGYTVQDRLALNIQP